MSGVKHDAGKLRYGLVPTDALRSVVGVLTFGASKYTERNWEKGMAWSRPYGAMRRHMEAWWSGETIDPETGYSHMAHAVVNGLFLLAYELRGMFIHDDRERLNDRDFRAIQAPPAGYCFPVSPDAIAPISCEDMQEI